MFAMSRYLLSALLAACVTALPNTASSAPASEWLDIDPCDTANCATVYTDGTLEVRSAKADAADLTVFRGPNKNGWTRVTGLSARAVVRARNGHLYVAGDIASQAPGGPETAYAVVYRLNGARGRLDLVAVLCNSMLIRVEGLADSKGGVVLSVRDYGNWDPAVTRNGPRAFRRELGIATDAIPLLYDPCSRQ